MELERLEANSEIAPPLAWFATDFTLRGFPIRRAKPRLNFLTRRPTLLLVRFKEGSQAHLMPLFCRQAVRPGDRRCGPRQLVLPGAERTLCERNARAANVDDHCTQDQKLARLTFGKTLREKARAECGDGFVIVGWGLRGSRWQCNCWSPERTQIICARVPSITLECNWSPPKAHLTCERAAPVITLCGRPTGRRFEVTRGGHLDDLLKSISSVEKQKHPRRCTQDQKLAHLIFGITLRAKVRAECGDGFG
jgi:hypothetical protein